MSVEKNLIHLIEREGPLSVSRFMYEVLLHPVYGYYYNASPIGAKGDFITAPEISQMFGEMVGVWAAYYFEQIGRPDSFSIVELGPGRGILISDLLRATRSVPGFHAALKLHLVEINNNLLEEQKNALCQYPHIKVSWHKNILHIPNDGPIIFIANEFFDALPIRQYMNYHDHWYERVVDYDSKQGFFFALSKIPNMLRNELAEHYPKCPEGGIVELSSAAVDSVRTLYQYLSDRGGAALVVDYGYDEVTRPFRSTLQAVRRHKPASIFANIGFADVTSLVDFTIFAKTAEQYPEVEIIGPMTQAVLLNELGIKARAQDLLARTFNEQIQQDLARLINPEHMGELFKAVIMLA
jgi:NADH dehydrogenase [ubiquinone] 1 alpha subcomplex assembly factor 7